RWRVGMRHVEIGLNQVYTNVALSRLRTGMVRTVQEGWQGDPKELKATVRALNALLDLDLATIEDAYQVEYFDRQQRVERLAAIDQVRIVFANLVRNAREAMPKGGSLTITGRQVSDGVEVAVADTGVGIPPELLSRIMEPLYSTKARGLGLGLAIARAILDK